MTILFNELSKEQRITLGKALLDAIIENGGVEFNDSFNLNDETEIYRMNRIEVSECISNYLDSVNSDINEWMQENNVELFWVFNGQDSICTRETVNELLEYEFEDMVELAERCGYVSEFYI